MEIGNTKALARSILAELEGQYDGQTIREHVLALQKIWLVDNEPTANPAMENASVVETDVRYFRPKTEGCHRPVKMVNDRDFIWIENEWRKSAFLYFSDQYYNEAHSESEAIEGY